MDLSHLSEPIRQGRRPASNVGQAINHLVKREAPVEAIRERAEIAAEVFPSHRMIGSVQRILDVAEHGVIGKSGDVTFSADPLLAELPPLASGHWRQDGLHFESNQAPVSEWEEQVRGQYRDRQTDVVERWILSRLELTIITLATGASS